MPLTTSWNIVGSTSDASICAHAGEAGTNFVPEDSVTNTLWRVNELHDGSLAYRVSCHRGICASCIMKVNGKTKLGCVTEVTGDLLLVEPAFPNKVVKDLVVEQE